MKYRENPQAIANLVQPDQVHRDVYIDPDIFHLEMKYLKAVLEQHPLGEAVAVS